LPEDNGTQSRLAHDTCLPALVDLEGQIGCKDPAVLHRGQPCSSGGLCPCAVPILGTWSLQRHPPAGRQVRVFVLANAFTPSYRCGHPWSSICGATP